MHSPKSLLRTFAREHDDLPAFHAAYVVFVFLAAALLSSGFFMLCVLAHVTLDVMKYRDVHGFTWKKTLRAALRDNLIDAVFLLFALVMAVYLHQESGIALAGGLARTPAALVRAVGMVFPKMQILGRTMRVFSDVQGHLRSIQKGLSKPWSGWERVLLATVVVQMLLLAAATVILGIDVTTYAQILAGQLVPWSV